MSESKKTASSNGAQKPQKTQKQNWKKIDHPAYYANIMQIGLSPFDVSVVFGKVGNATTEEITCIPQATITISPEQAANLMQMLAASLQGYIKQFGNLRGAVLGNPGLETPPKELNEG